jgi:methyl-accepting chemotaxis protein
MNEVVASVKRVTDIMSEIRLAGQEQSAGIAQVNQAIAQMDQVTQQNAALVEEAAAAADSMHDQATQLSTIVGRFKVADEAPRIGAAPKPLASRQARLVAPARSSARKEPVAIAHDEWEASGSTERLHGGGGECSVNSPLVRIVAATGIAGRDPEFARYLLRRPEKF